MKRSIAPVVFALLAGWTVPGGAVAAPEQRPAAIIRPADAPANVNRAAKELRRYIYLRTGELLPINDAGKGIVLRVDKRLGPQQYRLQGDGAALTISGGSDVAVLYGAYHFVEKIGVRFYLHGDVIPDRQIPPAIPALDETHQPLFELRGIQPFHDFFEGPDWWNADDYKAYAAQLAKLRMNFIGLHNYPERGGGYPGPEPTVWIGLPEDCDEQCEVTYSYPAFFANTRRPGWGMTPTKTSEYAGGAASLFPTDVYGPDVQAPYFPRPEDPADCNEVFNRTAGMYRDAFGLARRLTVHLRPLGRGDWQAVPAKHLGRAVYEVALPPAQEDFEYHVTAETNSGAPLVWPATAPRINQTVVVAPLSDS
ncbi:MAG: hypothetical protein NTV49_13850 [Kiritimatiellaeota bacterium]|nr:hypothetical protein [Kiritimatiellota bacterium]